ncbi:hypothetical protein CHS0354_016681 [Potamilus streckersoni]|uniref:Uncharacterized protein n=1 Tax=Potamilus streckersoni TaxID=2493646 RepID=A0AAE0THE6_9BIVA|nr:hypothetical protein CHS0354_016681 [Potamilus streckersoni]
MTTGNTPHCSGKPYTAKGSSVGLLSRQAKQSSSATLDGWRRVPSKGTTKHGQKANHNNQLTLRNYPSPFSGVLGSDQFITSSDPSENSTLAGPSKIAHERYALEEKCQLFVDAEECGAKI